MMDLRFHRRWWKGTEVTKDTVLPNTEDIQPPLVQDQNQDKEPINETLVTQKTRLVCLTLHDLQKRNCHTIRLFQILIRLSLLSGIVIFYFGRKLNFSCLADDPTSPEVDEAYSDHRGTFPSRTLLNSVLHVTESRKLIPLPDNQERA
ncbi:hypothetical protein Tco_0652512 [Tanacetum coccineum]|uniref:Uncharacterized protein n=1 Tax=Tanacetum coccineum TaxID=301880 RepID=A0ABQ4WY38_9ASTR